MWKIILVCAVIVGTVDSVQRKRYISSSSGRGNYAPDYGFIDPFEFHQKLTQQILAQQSAQNKVSRHRPVKGHRRIPALTSIYASGDASAYADASNYPDYYDELFQEQFGHQQAFFDAIRRQTLAAAAGGGGGYAGGYSGNYAPNFASASGTYGPGGGYQSAAVYPENPSLPNIHNRFSESATGGGGGDNGFHGVSVSSFAHSADVNGKRTSNRGATTTINDNGKVTTYRVHS